MIENTVTQDTFVEYDDQRNDISEYFIVPSTIGPEDGRHLFSYLGVFLTYFTPRDLNVVNCILELLKTVLETRSSVLNLIWEVSSKFIRFI